MTDRLHGKTCLVTGAAQGIGKAVADAFLREGARVVVTDLQAEKLSAAFDHPRAVAARMDVTDPAAVGAVIKAHPEVDVLANCAGWVAEGRS